ncbi:MAG: glycosyltransferase family 2 protein, partial [Pseudomonadota bacterium]|nr:glycosyltransferase family 2 protein [Pseudomonadota bacterium]
MLSPAVSVVIPAKNESGALGTLLPKLIQVVAPVQVLLVDDGSTDGTAAIARSFGVQVVSHPYSMGNGAAIKSGARAAKGDTIVFMDADGQHDPADIERLVARLNEGYDMVVGARSRGGQASLGRGVANRLYNRLASYMANRRVEDLTSGFRVVRADKFREFLHLLPNGFSYPTTSTMAFFRSAYPVAYEPIRVSKRVGKSHIRPLRDGARFLLIIFKIGTLYSPLKLFAPLALFHFLVGLGYYGYTFFTQNRLTNMTVLLMTG